MGRIIIITSLLLSMCYAHPQSPELLLFVVVVVMVVKRLAARKTVGRNFTFGVKAAHNNNDCNDNDAGACRQD